MKHLKKPTKRKRGADVVTGELTQEIQDAIKSAAKVVSEAKQAYEKAWRDAFEPLAEEIGYATPKEAAELIMEDVEDDICSNRAENHTAEKWEKYLTAYACRQLIDWKKEELDDEIRILESKRSKL